VDRGQGSSSSNPVDSGQGSSSSSPMLQHSSSSRLARASSSRARSSEVANSRCVLGALCCSAEFRSVRSSMPLAVLIHRAGS
jgi:hypothetical protein